jgi:hypothetical protein
VERQLGFGLTKSNLAGTYMVPTGRDFHSHQAIATIKRGHDGDVIDVRRRRNRIDDHRTVEAGVREEVVRRCRKSPHRPRHSAALGGSAGRHPFRQLLVLDADRQDVTAIPSQVSADVGDERQVAA